MNIKARTRNEVRELNGYRLIYEPEHKRAMTNENWKGFVYEHILVAEKYLNRKIRDEEVVHHLDGNRSNNRRENLLVLEHSQHGKLHFWLETGAPFLKKNGMQGLNSGKSKIVEPEFCKSCGRTLQEKQIGYCSPEHAKFARRKAIRPTRNQLEKDIKNLSWLAIGRKYGVSDNAVRKWAKQYKLL